MLSAVPSRPGAAATRWVGVVSVGRSCSLPDLVTGEADFPPIFQPPGDGGVARSVALWAAWARLCWWAAGKGCPLMQSHFPSSSLAWSSAPQTRGSPWGWWHLSPLGPSMQGVMQRTLLLGLLGGLAVVFLPPDGSGLLDGSQGAKQSAVAAESSQVAQPAWSLNGKPDRMSKSQLWRGGHDQLPYSWWPCKARGIAWPFHVANPV